MPLRQNELEWLSRFAGATMGSQTGGQADLMVKLQVARTREEIAEQALKEMLIERAMRVIRPAKGEMRSAFDMKVSAGGQTMRIGDESGRAEKAFGLFEDTLDASITGREARDCVAAMSMITEQKEILARATVERTQLNKKKTGLEKRRDRLFLDKEIMEELYTPLVRELVLPDDQVPNKYSKTQQMIVGSNDPYIKECKAKGGSLPSGAAEIGKGVVAVGSQAAISIDVSMFSELTAISNIAAGAAAMLNAGIDVGQAIANKEFTASDWRTVAVAVGSSVTSALTAPWMYSSDAALKNLGKMVGASVTAALAGGGSFIGHVAEWRKQGGDFPWSDVAADLSAAITGGLTAGIGAVSAGAAGSDATRNTNIKIGLTALSGGAAALIRAGLDANKADIMAAIRSGQWSKFSTIFVNVCSDFSKTAVATLASDENDQIKKATTAPAGASDTEKAALKVEWSKLSKDVTNQVFFANAAADASSAAGQAVSAWQALEEERRLAHAKEKQLAEGKNLNAVLDQERANFRDALESAGAGTPGQEDFKSIARLIEQIETDRAIWGTLIAVGSASSAVATAFFRPIWAAGDLVNFIANARAAYDRAVALRTWLETKNDALTAVSPYATSIQNFVRNQGEQLTQRTIQAAANTIEAALKVASTFDPYGACAGAAIAVGAAAGLESLVYKVYQQSALRRAWATTKRSLQHPENRKLALIARNLNPTLAKYTIAYGALIDRDPIAIGVMSEIGLDRETLARAGDKVSDVKKYLQIKYADDNIILGHLPEPSNGRRNPPPPALTTKAWALSVMIWRAQDGLASSNPPTIIQLLAQVERHAAVDNEQRAIAAFPRYIGALQALAREFRAFRPVTEAGRQIVSVRRVVEVYTDLAEAEAELVDHAQAARLGAVSRVEPHAV